MVKCWEGIKYLVCFNVFEFLYVYIYVSLHLSCRHLVFLFSAASSLYSYTIIVRYFFLFGMYVIYNTLHVRLRLIIISCVIENR